MELLAMAHIRVVFPEFFLSSSCFFFMEETQLGVDKKDPNSVRQRELAAEELPSGVLVLFLQDFHHIFEDDVALLGGGLNGRGVVVGRKYGHNILLLLHVLHEPKVYHARGNDGSVIHAHLNPPTASCAPSASLNVAKSLPMSPHTFTVFFDCANPPLLPVP